MYNDSTFDYLFTGQESGGDYVYPSADQNLVITFSGFYLSALDGDFSTDPVTITSETGEAEDITIGNAPAKVLTAQMLNPFGTMESLTWGDGTVYIGCVKSSATADTYSSLPCHVYVNSIHYGINASGNARRGSTTYTLGGTPMAVIANATGTDVLFITDTKIGRYNGSFSVVSTPTDAQAFMAAKCRQYADPMGIALDANGCPAVFNDVTASTKTTYGYVPMGVFDFSNVDAYGITFGVEAYDKMILFDADATAWWNALDFDNGGSGRQLDWLAGQVVSQVTGSAPTISASAVNKTTVWHANPITSYAVTYRDLLKWLAQGMGCNVRMTRTGGVEFYVFDPTPITDGNGNPIVITPYTIIGNTRVKAKDAVPAIDKLICYDVLGAGYTEGAGTVPYYVVGNPFIDPSGGGPELSNLLDLLDDIPAYYATTVTNADADPRFDAGDFITIKPVTGSNYAIPLMHQTLSWNGICTASLSATGKQVRDIPEGMNNTDLSSMVDSNPSAVVNKIQAVGISADWITTGKLTVLDANDDVLFEADKDNKTVQIGGFTVEDDQLEFDNASRTIRIDNAEIYAENKSSHTAAYVWPGRMGVQDITDAHTPTATLDYDQLRFYTMANVEHAEYERSGATATYGSSVATFTPSSIGVTDGTNAITQAPTGVTFDDGIATPTLRVIRRTSDSADTKTVTLEDGVYIAIVTHRNNSSTNESGLYIIQVNNTSSIRAISTAQNQTLSISGHTLTWTTSNTYRQLRLIYIS